MLILRAFTKRLPSTAVDATFALVSCGGGDSGGTVSSATKCGGRGESSVDISADLLPVLFGSDAPEGSITVEVLAYEDLPDTIEDSSFEGEVFVARGDFVGVRYRLVNNASQELQLSSQFTENLRLTDGEQSWAVADYNSDHFGAPGWEWSEQNGDVGGATYVGAGFADTTWAVFDVPGGTDPTGLGFQLANGRSLCLGLTTN